MEIVQLENQLMRSNCFIVVDWDYSSCLIIDPASLEAKKEIDYIEEHSLTLDFIIMTHEHADHCWGVSKLREAYPSAKLIYAEACNKNMKRSIRLFFQLYSEDPNYRYEVQPAEIQVSKYLEKIHWHGNELNFLLTPGHSLGSICIDIGGMLFTGDTIMPYPPYFNGRGSSKEEWESSVLMIERIYAPHTMIYPGHGEVLTLEEWRKHDNWSRI